MSKNSIFISATVKENELDETLRDRLYSNAVALERKYLDEHASLRKFDKKKELSDLEVRKIYNEMKRLSIEEMRSAESKIVTTYWFFFDLMISTGARMVDIANENDVDIDGGHSRIRHIQIDPVRNIVWFKGDKPGVYQPVIVTKRFINHYQEYCKYLFIDPNTNVREELYKPVFDWNYMSSVKHAFGRIFNIVHMQLRNRPITSTRSWFERRMYEISGGNSVFMAAQMRTGIHSRSLLLRQYMAYKDAFDLQKYMGENLMDSMDDFLDKESDDQIMELSRKILMLEDKSVIKLCDQMRRQLDSSGNKKGSTIAHKLMDDINTERRDLSSGA